MQLLLVSIKTFLEKLLHCSDVGSSYDLLVGHGDHISQIHFEGTSSETVRTDTTGRVVGVDYLDS